MRDAVATHIDSRSVPRSGFPLVGRGGNANIQGQAFLKTLGGDVKTCAGQIVALFPNNSYTQAAPFAMAASQADAVRPAVDNRLDNYTRSVRCDAQGNFAFTNIRPNTWVVVAPITWFAPSEYGLKQQGGTLAQGNQRQPRRQPHDFDGRRRGRSVISCAGPFQGFAP